MQATDGNLYGTTESGINVVITVFKMTTSGALTTLYSFCFQPDCEDGDFLTRIGGRYDGNFYGVTGEGGANCIGHGGCGTLFKMIPSGMLTTLYSFCSPPNCTDGTYPCRTYSSHPRKLLWDNY